MNITDHGSVMNNATVTGKDVDIELERVVLSDGASVLDMANIEQQEPAPCNNPAPEGKKKAFGKQLSSFCQDVLANVIATKLTKG